MRNYRRNCLIISIICFAIVGLLFTQLCQADTTVDFYSVIIDADEFGFDPGPGVRAEIEYRPIEWASIQAYGQYAWIHKHPHNSGHHEWYGGSARLYLQENIFISGGYGYSGYESGPWEKGDWTPEVSAGWNGDIISAYATYHFPDSTAYETQAISLTGRYQFTGHWAVRLRYVSAWFDHPDIDTADSLTLGIGWRF